MAPNHGELLLLRAVVVSVGRKGGTRFRQVRSGETSESEPLMTCRKVQDDVETGWNSLTRDESGGWPDFCPGGIRHKGGVTLNQASMWNAGTCRLDAKATPKDYRFRSVLSVKSYNSILDGMCRP